MKAPLSIMAGLDGSDLNEYYAADNALVAYNTVVGCVGPAICIGVGNSAKGKQIVAPKNVLLIGNLIMNTSGDNNAPIAIADQNATFKLKDNFYNNGTTNLEGFTTLSSKDIQSKDGFNYYSQSINQAVIDTINERLAIQKINLSKEEITWFNPAWKLSKNDVGVSWIK